MACSDNSLPEFPKFVAAYTVAYDAGTDVRYVTVPTDQTKNHDVALTLNDTVPTRTGYSFANWNTSADGSGTSYASGASYTANADITLYAQWTANTYTITYNAGTDVIGVTLPDNQTKIHDVDLTLSSAVPTRIGYAFDSWNTLPNGTGKSYYPESYYADNANITLYAQWTVNTYTVIYNANGGTDAPGNQMKTHDIELTLRSAPTRTGYTFAGWNTSANGNGTAYAPEGSYTANAGITLYAQWTAIYTVTYNANYGTGAPGNQTKTYGIDLTLSAGTPTRIGYTFAGWNTLYNGTGTSYVSGAIYSENANLTLYAQWTANTYTVTYNANGGTGTPDNQTKIHDVPLTLSTDKPTKTGYGFAGWNTLANGTGKSYASGASYTDDADVTLYAQWPTYTMTFNANGGTGVPPNKTTIYDEKFYFSCDQPTRTGYAFVGWNTSADGSGNNYLCGAYWYRGRADVTLYAQWTQAYTVTYNANGGIGAPDKQTGIYDVAVQNFALNERPKLSNAVPTRTGYAFAGWNTSADGTGKSYSSGIIYTGNADVTLYAQWRSSPAVVSNCDGQTFKAVTIGTQTWMAENLNCNVVDSKCYNNDESHCDTYGRLYDWATAMALSPSCNSNSCASQISTKHRGICPIGWHIPSDAEWTTLIDFVGGKNVAGIKLKATSGWNSDCHAVGSGDYFYYCGLSGNGTNDFSFSALPGGESFNYGGFSSVGDCGYWWSASEAYSYSAYPLYTSHGTDGALDNDLDKRHLFSVRCLQD